MLEPPMPTQSSKTIRLLVADDHPIVRQGLVAILNAQSDMSVIAEANNGQQAIEQFRLHQPDVAILDLQMPEVGGVEAIIAIDRTIRTQHPSVPTPLLGVKTQSWINFGECDFSAKPSTFQSD